MNIRQQMPTKTNSLPPISLVLYGEAKVGKTATAGEFPAPLFLNLEDGCRRVTGDILDVRSATELADALGELEQGLRAGRLAYHTIVLDGLTTFVTAAALKVPSRDARKVAKDMAALFVPILAAFYDLPAARVITLHARSSSHEIKLARDGGGKETALFTADEPDVSPRLRTYLLGRADAIGYCHTQDNRPVVDWLPTETATRRIVAGNRLGLPRQTALAFAELRRALTAPPAPAITEAARPPVAAPRPATEASAPESAAVPANGHGGKKSTPTDFWTFFKTLGLEREVGAAILRECGNDCGLALARLKAQYAGLPA